MQMRWRQRALKRVLASTASSCSTVAILEWFFKYGRFSAVQRPRHSSNERFPPTPAQIVMDAITKAKLKAISKQSPRYLYRLWSNGENPSGGYHGLNTPTAITPLAFFRGQGHESAYHMIKEEFTGVALNHVRWQYIATEFSSWSASLVFILRKCPGTENVSRTGDGLYVSIIDAEMLQEINQIFYVPLLDFLEPGQWDFPHEYLIHGIVKGPWHKAIPYSAFAADLFVSYCPCLGINCPHVGTYPSQPLTEDYIQRVRAIGEFVGGEFALPIALAILCCTKRDRDLWMHGVSTEDLDAITRGLKGLKIPESWQKRHPIVAHAISCQNFNDTKQMTMLVRALMKQSKASDYLNEQRRTRFENSQNNGPQTGPSESQTDHEGEQDVDRCVHGAHEAKEELSKAAQELPETLDGLDLDVYTEDDDGAKIERLGNTITSAIFRMRRLT